MVSNPYTWIFLSIFLLHLLGLLWTENIDYGIKDLRVKLPLLLLPIVIGGSQSLQKSEWQLLFKIYILTLLVLTLFSFHKLLIFKGMEVYEKRNLSIHISHIRYGLNIAFAACLLLVSQPIFNMKISKYFFALYFLCCLLIFELYTGLICFIAFFFIWLFIQVFDSTIKQTKRLFILLLTLAIATSGIYYVIEVYHDFAREEQLAPEAKITKELTINGNESWTHPNDSRKINGVKILRNVSFVELHNEWPKKSTMDLKGKDRKGQKLERTLIHFLTSKGFNKDSLAFHKLTDEEIKAIENGIPNYRYMTLNPIERRLHATFYEIDFYKNEGYVEGLSLMLRIHYWKTALKIIKDAPWYGVGTGDVETSFQQAYEQAEQPISEQYRRRTHNQYLTFWVTFGLGGLLLWIFFLFSSLYKKKGDYQLIYLAFWIISILSFIPEDTLETQAGVTFFALFNVLFVLGIGNNQDQTSR